MKTLRTLGTSFNRRHSWLLRAAKNANVALCGGCAAAVTKGNEDYVPKDIDFAAKKDDAIAFIGQINSFLLSKSVHYRIYVNSQNKFVPSAARAHFRVTCPFWLPICIFVLPDTSFRSYRIKGGYWLQLYADIQDAAQELTELDAKPRIAMTNIEEPEEDPAQPAPIDGEEIEHSVSIRIGSGARKSPTPF